MIGSILTLLLLVSCLILFSDNIINIVVLSGIFSLLAVGFYVSAGAVDVALTEIVVSCGVFGILTLLTVCIVGCNDNSKSYIHYGYISLFVLFLCLVSYFILGINEFSGAFSPSYSGVSKYYLFNSMKDAHIPNVVTTILASYRGYDTLGETVVIFVAAIGLYILLRDVFFNHKCREKPAESTYPVISNTIILILPLIILYSLIVELHGDFSAGGGFQAGVIFASALICYNLVTNCNSINFCYARRSAFFMSLGIIIYIIVGLVCILKGAEFLNYSLLDSISYKGQHLGIFIVEIGIAITVASSMICCANVILLFYADMPSKHVSIFKYMDSEAKCDLAKVDKKTEVKVKKISLEKKEQIKP